MEKSKNYPVHKNAEKFQAAWVEAYCTPQADAHSKFSELTGLSRQEAKEIAYAFMWSETGRDIFMVNQFNRVNRESFFIYMRLAKMLGDSAPALEEILKEID